MILDASFGGSLIKAGQSLPKGSSINLTLGNGLGASEVDIPNLLGLNLNEAKMALMGSSLSLGNIAFEGAADSLHSKVIRQYPAISDSLSKVSIGTPIDIILSGGN